MFDFIFNLPVDYYSGYGGYYAYGYDYKFLILIGIATVITMIAQAKVKTAYNKYGQIRNSNGLTGAQAAREILDDNGLFDVKIVKIAGQLTDNYNPTTNTVSLSEGVHDSSSIAAIGIAAHEVGHAIQHNTGYLPVKIRTALVPAVNFSSRISWILILLGIALSSMGEIFYYVAVGGVVLYSLATVFSLVTLPVEINASNRAKYHLERRLVVSEEDMAGVKKVLSAAAMTYMASLLVSAVYLLRMVSLVSRNRNRR